MTIESLGECVTKDTEMRWSSLSILVTARHGDSGAEDEGVDTLAEKGC